MTFDEALERRKKNRIMVNEQDFRHGWNAALMAAGAICDAEAGGWRVGDAVCAAEECARSIRALEVEVQT